MTSMNLKTLFSERKDSMLLISVFVGYLFTLIPTIITAINMQVIYTEYETLLPWGLACFSTGAFLVAFYSIIQKSSTMYVIFYFGFNALLAIIFSVFSQIWIIIVIVEVFGIVAAKKSTNESRKFFPRLKTAKAWGMVALAIASLIVPVLMYFTPPKMEYQIEMLPSRAGQNLEINFALANNSAMPADLLEILNRTNHLSNINISVEIPILEELIFNTSLLVGLEMPDRGDYLKSKEEYVVNVSTQHPEYSASQILSEARKLYDEDLNRFEDDWLALTTAVKEKVNSMTYEEIFALNESYFDLEGLLANQTRMLANVGIAVDYMPLLEAEVYVNDNTIFRINKTLTLFKKFVEFGNLEKAHRGLIFDTEMDWNIRYGMLLEYTDYATHEQGILELGKMVQMTKLWEWAWKDLDDLHGEYTEAKWGDFALNARVTYVGSATFGMHLDDLWDLDDAQQNALKISIATAKDDAQFDFIGIMTYETQDNSEHAVYGYCRAGDYFFGEANVPYIYSGINDLREYKDRPQEYLNEIIRKFRIIQNYGYPTTGIWGLTHLYCFSEWDEGWCGGLYDFLKAYWTPEAIYWMAQNLTVAEPITFSAEGMNFAFIHPAFTLLDAYLITKIRYGTYPINNNVRIRPDEFINYPYVLNWVIGIALFLVVGILMVILAKKNKIIGQNKVS